MYFVKTCHTDPIVQLNYRRNTEQNMRQQSLMHHTQGRQIILPQRRYTTNGRHQDDPQQMIPAIGSRIRHLSNNQPALVASSEKQNRIVDIFYYRKPLNREMRRVSTSTYAYVRENRAECQEQWRRLQIQNIILWKGYPNGGNHKLNQKWE